MGRRVGEPSRGVLALRGALFVVLGIGIAVLLVLRGTGGLDRDIAVSVDLPAEVGLITGEAPVRYAGVNVGRIAAIEPGATSSTVRLSIGDGHEQYIPADVIARVVPRTFFGDIYIQLVPAGAGTEETLANGDRIDADTGPDAVALYDIYTRLFDILERMQPQHIQAALTAIGQALDGKGRRLGESIDHWTSASRMLAPAMRDMLAGSPELVTVLQAIDRATPDMADMLASATSLSRQFVDNRAAFDSAVGSAAAFAPVVDTFLGTNRESLITVVDASGDILATTGANPGGIVRTIDGAGVFGSRAAVVFASGRFDITAVPSFGDPLPYGPADCPRYGAMTGPICGSAIGTAPPRTHPLAAPSPAAPAPVDPQIDASSLPPGSGDGSAVVGGAAEAPVLELLEAHLGISMPASSRPASSGTTGPDPTSAVMLGPLLRGNEVTLR